jgi:hypothetical protein
MKVGSLLSREQFEALVFAKTKGQCLFCSLPAVDPHHILDRKLFADGGYYESNGAPVCAEHHWQCEMTVLSVEAVRSALHIEVPLLPAGFRAELRYDKWGNRIRNDGLREAGPLFNDTGCRKALAKAGILGRFVPVGTPEEI